MAYKVGYTTLPTITDTTTIGYTVTNKDTGTSSSTAYAWFNSTAINITSQGVYNLTANGTFKSGANGYAYIICDSLNQGVGSIWFTAGGTNQPMSASATYSDNLPSTGGSYSTYSGYFPVACQALRQSGTPSVQFSLTVTLRVTGSCNFVLFMSSSASSTAYNTVFTATRIA